MAFTDEERKYVIELYNLNNGNIRQVIEIFFHEKNFRISETSARRILKESGLELQQRGGARGSRNGKNYNTVFGDRSPSSARGLTKYLTPKGRRF